MCNNKFVIYDPLPARMDLSLESQTFKRHDFTCDQVKLLREDWIKEFSDRNRCRPNDTKLKEYTEELDEFIGRCKNACAN